MDIHIDLEAVKFFVVLVIAGSAYGYYVYRKGLIRGWDNAMYSLEEEGLIHIDDDGEVLRVSDKEYKEYRNFVEQSEY
jgi:hypothetical protein